MDVYQLTDACQFSNYTVDDGHSNRFKVELIADYDDDCCGK